jgi:hypothetical protein
MMSRTQRMRIGEVFYRSSLLDKARKDRHHIGTVYLNGSVDSNAGLRKTS